MLRLHRDTNKPEKRDTMSPPSTLILGVGNILLSDEGVGVRVIEAMQSQELPNNVELLDGGTTSLGLLDSLANRDKVIIIDAVKGGYEPGTLYRFTPSDITTERHNSTSLHQIGLLETLSVARYLGCAPQQVIIFGIEPKEIDWGLGLSAEVAALVPKVIELVLVELGGKHA